MVFTYNKIPFETDGRLGFHNVGQKITQGVGTAARVVGTAKKAYDVGMPIYKLGTLIAPFLI